jgi:hypothetical protein
VVGSPLVVVRRPAPHPCRRSSPASEGGAKGGGEGAEGFAGAGVASSRRERRESAAAAGSGGRGRRGDLWGGGGSAGLRRWGLRGRALGLGWNLYNEVEMGYLG